MTALRLEARDLDTLPLLPLAEDLAERWGALVIAVTDLELTGAPLRGVLATRPGTAVIMLHGGLTQDERDEVFAHELAHLVDRFDGRVRHTPAGERRRELFANRLAPVLLDQRPASLPEVRPLASKARKR